MQPQAKYALTYLLCFDMINNQTVNIQSIGALGEGIGTLSDGLKVFVEGALPGEEVEILLTQKKKNYARGQLLRVVTSSPSRISPICPLFGTCGGCHLMHLNYEEQCRLKRQRVIDALQRVGKQVDLPLVHACIPSPHPLHYRNKIQLPIEISDHHHKIGLYRKQTHDVIDVPQCFIHNHAGEQLYTWLREHLPLNPSLHHVLIRQGIFSKETLLVLVTKGDTDLRAFSAKVMQVFPRVVGVVENINTSAHNVVLSTCFRPLAGRPYFTEQLRGKTFRIGPGSFFQVNAWQAENLIDTVVTLAQLQPHEVVYDAYTGVGTFALFMADHAKRVIGTECVAEAISYAKQNAQLNGHHNCEFFVQEAQPRSADVTLLNPPRKGCDRSVLDNLNSPRVIYISCDPATLARDLALLSQYKVCSVTPFDLFPQTIHVETVVVLERK